MCRFNRFELGDERCNPCEHSSEFSCQEFRLARSFERSEIAHRDGQKLITKWWEKNDNDKLFGHKYAIYVYHLVFNHESHIRLFKSTWWQKITVKKLNEITIMMNQLKIEEKTRPVQCIGCGTIFYTNIDTVFCSFRCIKEYNEYCKSFRCDRWDDGLWNELSRTRNTFLCSQSKCHQDVR